MDLPVCRGWDRLLVVTVGVAHPNSSGAEGSVDGAGVDVVAVADAGEGLAVLVEPDGVIDVFGVESSPAHGDALVVQVQGHGVAVDPELVRQLVDRCSGSVLLGQQGDLDCG